MTTAALFGGESGTTCSQCQHEFNPHILVATGSTPTDGGVMFCPECDCIATWSVPPMSTREDVIMPDDETLAEMRKILVDGA